MSLYQRLRGEHPTLPSGGKISPHTLAGGCQEVLRGQITQAQLVTALNLQADEQGELTTIKGWYDALSAAGGSLRGRQGVFLTALERVWNLVETGHYNEAQATASISALQAL